ncbi:hypothetical protein M0Q97_02625 [Candidatus Dojkabacteria bacterium]|jgi:hypothetical protein|nr:hypothetical protein [Candidatus Dojkabacteria bacterium]
MKKYQDYSKNRTIDLTNEELKNIEWTKFKIIVPTLKDKIELEEAIEYIHCSDIDTDYITVNQLAHHYLNEDEGYINNIIVDEKLYNNLPEYKKNDVSEIKKFENF